MATPKKSAKRFSQPSKEQIAKWDAESRKEEMSNRSESEIESLAGRVKQLEDEVESLKKRVVAVENAAGL